MREVGGTRWPPPAATSALKAATALGLKAKHTPGRCTLPYIVLPPPPLGAHRGGGGGEKVTHEKNTGSWDLCCFYCEAAAELAAAK